MPSKRPQRSSPNANAVDQLDFTNLTYRRRQAFEGCDYFAVHRVGKKTYSFIANILARDKAEAIKVARRQCVSLATKERTYLQAVRIGFSGYCTALRSVSYQK